MEDFGWTNTKERCYLYPSETLWAITNLRCWLLVDSFLSISDVTAWLDSGTVLNSVSFGAAVYQTTFCCEMSQKISGLRGRSVSKTWGLREAKLLHLRPCKTSLVEVLKLREPVARIHLYNWFLQYVHDGKVDPQFVFFCDAAWFTLRGPVNSRNIRYCSAENPGLIY